ncbi:CPBP family intramembrane glutamic endopeptidase [Lysinibacillus irui]|uniref:CPBP family intramembrane metalloprotease n=2 Tax=Lysinibacillus irui TaxID=2998077 RepID=A0AAJ5UYL0_9BACI|nr:CPBP family intramembrane glutamic endopeptidase [Lysinibacillus irui]MEA0563417.1 CPBP family intramembrane glutamic endopeptidase [Lysinibacillus irui]WDV09040.1 CPBP family intramembrane metalloprotease [Lysinibacillus irui]
MQLLIIAFIEETIFRGILLRMLLTKGVATAVWVSSILFGVTHALQLLGGQSLEDTIIQIIYALLVGSCSIIAYLRWSIHYCNNSFPWV